MSKKRIFAKNENLEKLVIDTAFKYMKLGDFEEVTKDIKDLFALYKDNSMTKGEKVATLEEINKEVDLDLEGPEVEDAAEPEKEVTEEPAKIRAKKDEEDEDMISKKELKSIIKKYEDKEEDFGTDLLEEVNELVVDDEEDEEDLEEEKKALLSLARKLYAKGKRVQAKELLVQASSLGTTKKVDKRKTYLKKALGALQNKNSRKSLSYLRRALALTKEDEVYVEDDTPERVKSSEEVAIENYVKEHKNNLINKNAEEVVNYIENDPDFPGDLPKARRTKATNDSRRSFSTVVDDAVIEEYVNDNVDKLKNMTGEQIVRFLENDPDAPTKNSSNPALVTSSMRKEAFGLFRRGHKKRALRILAEIDKLEEEMHDETCENRTFSDSINIDDYVDDNINKLKNMSGKQIVTFISQDPDFPAAKRIKAELENEEDLDEECERTFSDTEHFDDDILEKMANSTDEGIRQYVASLPHINKYPKLMESLAQDEAEWVRRELAERPDLPAHIVEILKKDSDASVREAVMESYTRRSRRSRKSRRALAASPSEFRSLVKDLEETPKGREITIYLEDFDLSDSQIRELARHSDSRIREEAASYGNEFPNTNLPVDVLDELSKDPNEEVRISLSIRNDLPTKIKNRLKKDASPVVRENVNYNEFNATRRSRRSRRSRRVKASPRRTMRRVRKIVRSKLYK